MVERLCSAPDGPADLEGLPTMVIVADAIGTLSGLAETLASVDIDCFAVYPPASLSVQHIWRVDSINQLATDCLTAVDPHLDCRHKSPLVIGGVGHGAIIAHEMALQLQSAGTPPRALVLFEGRNVAANPDADIQWLPLEARDTLAQVATALHPVIRSVGGRAPLGAVAARLASLDGFESQMSYLHSLAPPSCKGTWGHLLQSALLRLAYFKALSHKYLPGDIYPGRAMVVTMKDEWREPASLLDGPAGSWRSISRVLQPVSIHTLSACGAASNGQHIQEILIHAANIRSECTELSIIHASATPDLTLEKRSAEELKRKRTRCLVLPLNRLCPELKSLTLADSASSLVTPTPMSRIPVFLIHSERGDITATQRELARALPFPMYGLAMGSEAGRCKSLVSMSRHHARAIQAVSPSGPYIIVGNSIGSVLAHAVACRLQECGMQTALILLDGPAVIPTSMPLHSPTMYALYNFLQEVAGLKGSIGEFVDTLHAAGGAEEQFEFLGSYKVDAENEHWDPALYALLDRASIMEKLLAEHCVEVEHSPEWFDGPTVMLVPQGELGELFVEASKDGIAAESIVRIALRYAHTECLKTETGRKSVVKGLTEAVEGLIRKKY